MVGKVWPYVLTGIAVGAGIHDYVPEGLKPGLNTGQKEAKRPALLVLGPLTRGQGATGPGLRPVRARLYKPLAGAIDLRWQVLALG